MTEAEWDLFTQLRRAADELAVLHWQTRPGSRNNGLLAPPPEPDVEALARRVVAVLAGRDQDDAAVKAITDRARALWEQPEAKRVNATSDVHAAFDEARVEWLAAVLREFPAARQELAPVSGTILLDKPVEEPRPGAPRPLPPTEC